VQLREEGFIMTKSVSEKLGIKPASRAILIDAPADASKAIKLPGLNRVLHLRGEFDYIHFFAKTQSALKRKFSSLKKHLKTTGMLWISWPKSKQLNTDLTLPVVIKIGYDHGLVESKTMGINETWSAIKFTHPRKGKVYNNKYGKLREQD
jgi:hypothetical protein